MVMVVIVIVFVMMQDFGSRVLKLMVLLITSLMGAGVMQYILNHGEEYVDMPRLRKVKRYALGESMKTVGKKTA